MDSQWVSVLLAVFEGFVLILSPCILPILPILLASSVGHKKARPYGVITGFILTFSIFGAFSAAFVKYSGIDLNLMRDVAYLILLILGLTLCSTFLSERFSALTSGFSALGIRCSSVIKQSGGFISGLLFGSVIALIWTPCAGPILAAALVQIAIQKTTLISFFTLFGFAFGAAVPMLILAVYGLPLLQRLSFLKTQGIFFRKLLGITLLACVCFLLYQEKFGGVTTVPNSNIQTSFALEHGLWHPYTAPELGGITAWINTKPLDLSRLRGRVVLIDFWAYSCINCIRTLPYLKNWYKRYHDKGLVIIGVHAPEFEFEKDVDHVKQAVKRDGILYPVALDNDEVTWRNFHNHYWPALYLINKQGQVVYEHTGEGEDDITENNIRFLLGIDALHAPTSRDKASAIPFETPETYLGYARADRQYTPSSILPLQTSSYQFPPRLEPHAWALSGLWKVNAQNIISAQALAQLEIHFQAQKVYVVMGNQSKDPLHVKLRLNGKPVTTQQGKDVINSEVQVGEYRLYHLLSLERFESDILTLTASHPGLVVYTFTFGE